MKRPSHWPSITPVSEGVASASDLFAGYLMLDALIGNTDRHHENWAIIQAGRQYCLAPTFDHASCLGFNLSDAERIDRMTPGPESLR